MSPNPDEVAENIINYGKSVRLNEYNVFLSETTLVTINIARKPKK